MTPKATYRVAGMAGVALTLLGFAPNHLAFAEPNCVPVGGALMTNVGAIAGVTNLGPVSGDL
ncbi:MAG TPA: hypothetical protein VHW45_03295, partial [Candidatus Sulfotelmatobacter sp.]|nr:hypothetical protein [Candidatus Sulfotelmatobacter sp.]